MRGRHRTRSGDRRTIGGKPKARIDIDAVLGVDHAVMIPVRRREEPGVTCVRAQSRVQERLVGTVYNAVPIDVACQGDFVAESGSLGSGRRGELDYVGPGGIEGEERVARVAGRLRESHLESIHRRGRRLPAAAVDLDLERHLAGLGSRQFVRADHDVGAVHNPVSSRGRDQI